MTNSVILVGRIVHDLELVDSDKKYSKITIAIPRNYKNVDGAYDTDFIDIMLYGIVAENTCEYCRKGDIVGIRGRLETNIVVDNDGENKRKETIVIAERVSFLSSKKESE